MKETGHIKKGVVDAELDPNCQVKTASDELVEKVVKDNETNPKHK